MKNSTTLVALALFALTGCGAADADGDGFDSTIDCDDNDVAIHPGAIEHCDGVDNDCNGVADDTYADEASVFFVDVDGDGFGTAADSQTACSDVPPDGFVPDASDCDDDDADINPGAIELCNLVDDDCNKIIDDNPPDAPFFYADNDADGFGSLTLLVKACEAPQGWIKTGGDCNDFDFLTNPNSLEYCDGYDNDCDELIDEPDAEDHSVFYADLDADGFGDMAKPIDACYLPDGYSANDLDCNDDPANNGNLQVPGTEEICQDGLDNNCNDSADQCSFEGWNSVDDADYVVKGWGGGYLGYSLDGGADVDGDGNEDFIMGAYYSPVGSYTSGAGVLVYGEADGTLTDPEITGKDQPHWGTSTSYDYFGRHSESIGDIDNDGFDDVAVGSYSYDVSSSYSSEGTMAIIYGKSSRYAGGGVSIEDDETPSLVGPSSSTYLGTTFSSAGDQNGDTYPDMLVGGAYYRHEGVYSTGAVWVVPGASARYAHESGVDGFGKYVGAESYDYLGYFGPTVDSGDMDGDGRLEMAMGAYGAASYAGASYLVYGTGAMPSGTQDVTTASDASFTGSSSYEYVGGYMTQIPGDINNDGYDDLIIGHYQASSYAGACYIVLGGAAKVKGGVAASKADVTIKGAGSSSYLCYGRPTVADFNNDGVSELVLGSYRYTSGTGTYNGATFLFEGGPDFGAVQEISVTDAMVETSGPSGSYAYFGYQTTSGDFNGDGYQDLAGAAYGAFGYSGGVYIFLGNSL